MRVSAVEQWPQFRGTQAGVADDDPALPDRWSETDNVAWKTDIPGLGWSSPIVWGDHVFVTTAVSSGVEPVPAKGLFDPVGDHSRNQSTEVHQCDEILNVVVVRRAELTHGPGVDDEGVAGDRREHIVPLAALWQKQRILRHVANRQSEMRVEDPDEQRLALGHLVIHSRHQLVFRRVVAGRMTLVRHEEFLQRVRKRKGQVAVVQRIVVRPTVQ
jgi:hypothetical protein